MRAGADVVKRHGTRIRFRGDMDFVFAWILGAGAVVGLSAGELFALVEGLKDGDVSGWRERFLAHGARLERAAAGTPGVSGGQLQLAACFCLRAALHYVDPTGPAYLGLVERMDREFRQATREMRIPIREVEVPFEGHALPGYVLKHDEAPRPLLVMVGGGDTYREDLFTWAGYPAWRRGYNAMMVDLPGQGVLPARGLCFRGDMGSAVSAVLDAVPSLFERPPEKVAIYGVSGGGFFTAQAAARDRRVGWWIASTPITDMAEVFRRAFGAVAHAPRWLAALALRTAALREATEVSLKKYAFQLGTRDFRAAWEGVVAQATQVVASAITCPSLFLVGEGEADELKRQTADLTAELSRRGVDVTQRVLAAADGSEAHCQVDNFRLMHAIVFDWLDARVVPSPPPADPRLLAW